MGDDIKNKVITIAKVDSSATATGNIKKTIIDQDKLKYIFYTKKKDKTSSAMHSQFQDMGLDVGSVVEIGYKEEAKSFTATKGKDSGNLVSYTERSIISFRETNETPVAGKVELRPAGQASPSNYTPAQDRDFDKENVGKCQTIFLGALIQSGKPISEAITQVKEAKKLAELVVYGFQEKVVNTEALPVIQQGEDINVEDIPF